jgi:hypothetical protein
VGVLYPNVSLLLLEGVTVSLAKLSFNEGSALLLGAGYLSAYDGALYLTAGWKFKSPWYINAGVNLGETTGFSIGVGYSLFGK